MRLRVPLVLLLTAAVSAQSARPSDGLFAALARGDVRAVERALDGGADPNAVTADGTPALMLATLHGDVRLVERLLARGADPNRADAAGATALMWAVPDLAKMRAILMRGARVDAAAQSGRTALLVAASYPGSAGALRLLLERGADVRAQDTAGATALSLAVRSSDVASVMVLVERGLDPQALTPGARRVAYTRWDRPTTDFLAGAGVTPPADVLLSTAAWQPPALTARWIAGGADVNARNVAQYGRTPLHAAVTSELEGAEGVAALLDRGAQPNAETSEGETALDFAYYKGDTAKIRVLEARGARRGTGPRREVIAPPAAGGIADVRDALARSTQRLLTAASGFKTQTACVSCHHNGLPGLTAAVVARKGIAVDRPLAARNLDDVTTFFRTNLTRVLQGDPAVGGEALTVGYALQALAAAGHPADTMTAALAHWLLARQMPDGRWLGNGLNRPPSEYSLVSHVAMAAGGLVSYPLPGRRADMARGLERARTWLLTAPAASAEERAMRLMGLVWTDAPRGRIETAVRDVRAQQEPGGGWSQFSRTPADAYATGLSLHALHVAGVPPSDEAYRRGVAFLRGSQYPDGTWFVRTHTFPVQRYFESGFPFGRHQWISAAGTSWATLAIAHTLPDVVPAQRAAR